MEETDNHDLNTYTSGETGWTHSTDMEHIEELLPVRDTESNRNNYTPHADSIFIATDSGAVYTGDGSSWNLSGHDIKGLSIDSHNVVDLSNEGYDGNESKPLNDVWSEYGENTTYVLPEGTYRLEEDFPHTGGFEYVRFIGKPHATINVIENPEPIPEGSEDTGDATVFPFGSSGSAIEKIEIRNLTVNIEGTDSSDFDIDKGLMSSFFTDYCIVENVELVGARHRHQNHGTSSSPDWHEYGDRETFKAMPVNEDSVAHITNLSMMDGGTYEGDASGTVGHAIAVAGGGDGNSLGVSTYDSCQVAGFVDNGFYVRNEENRVILNGCFARNCGNGNIRVCRNDYVKNCEVEINSNVDSGLESQITPFFVDAAENLVVDGLKIDISGIDTNDVVRVGGDNSLSARGISMRNVDIDSDSNSNISIESPTDKLLMENWTVDDAGDEGAASTIKIGMNTDLGSPPEDPTITLRSCEINSDVRRVLQIDGPNVNLYDCRLDGGSAPGGGGTTTDVDILVGEFNEASETVETLRIRDTEFLGEAVWRLQSDETVQNWIVNGCRFPNADSSNPRYDIQGTVGEWHISENADWDPTDANDHWEIQKDGTDGEGIINFKTS